MKRLAVAVLVLVVCGCSSREAALQRYDLESKALLTEQRSLVEAEQELASNRNKVAELETLYWDVTERIKQGKPKGTDEKADAARRKMQAERQAAVDSSAKVVKELQQSVAKQKAKVAEAKQALDALE